MQRIIPRNHSAIPGNSAGRLEHESKAKGFADIQGSGPASVLPIYSCDPRQLNHLPLAASGTLHLFLARSIENRLIVELVHQAPQGAAQLSIQA